MTRPDARRAFLAAGFPGSANETLCFARQPVVSTDTSKHRSGIGLAKAEGEEANGHHNQPGTYLFPTRAHWCGAPRDAARRKSFRD